MRRVRSLSRQQGSITVMVAFLLPTMLLMLMLVSNVGQAVYEKIRLQNTVDACALAAATVQAAGLNEIADLNFELGLELIKLKIILVTTLWYNQSDGQACVDFFQRVFNAIHDYQDRANRDYARQALSTAQAVKRENLPDTKLESVNPRDDELITYTTDKDMVWYLYRICSCCPCGIHCQCECCPLLPTMTWMDALAGPVKFAFHHDGRMPSPANGILLPGIAQIETTIRKDREPMAYAAFKLTQPSKPFKFAAGIFGRMDAMTAYGAAKPAGGEVYPGRPMYKPAMVKLTSLRPAPRVPELARYEH